MDTSKIFATIIELGSVNSKRDELREHCQANIAEILKLLPRRILNSDGGHVLDCLFNGLVDSDIKNKVKVVDIVLNIMRTELTSITHCADVICRLRLELRKLPVHDLVRWCNDCVQSVVQDSDVNMVWGDILPECLNAICSHSTVKHCGTDMSSEEYKQQIVHALCQSKWTEKQTTQLVAMFTDMQLSREDHKQVVNKICSHIVDFPHDSLPPLVHQLVKLCKTYHIEIVLAHLSHYFNVRLYSKLEPPPQDSESTTMDIDDIVQHSPAELSRCLSTCIYHLTRAGSPELIRKHLRNWPKSLLLQSPFLVDAALAMSDKGSDFRVCLDVIRSAIEFRITQDQRSDESAWVRSVSPPHTDVASVLKVLTTESVKHHELTAMGLINLAFCLLNVTKTKPTAQACWSHGKLILVRLCKAIPQTADHILGLLADRLIAGDTDKRQYAECLHLLCKLTPLSVERCTKLRTILENTQPSPNEYKSAASVLDAVYPLINYSTRTRDSLFMVCRKGLYSRDSAHRCLALSGFLTILRHMKVSHNTVSTSQSVCSDQFSAHSYLTQLTVDFHATQEGNTVKSRVRNESVCMEVVSILQRCLLQDAAVKQLLYTKLYDCAKEKTILQEPILEMLEGHLFKYLPEDRQGSPLLIDKCVQVTPLTAVLVEPISQLLYLIIHFLQPEEEELEDILGSQSIDTASAAHKSRLCEVLHTVTSSDAFGDFDLDDVGLSDLTPESKAKCLQVQQTISCYETLIAHQLLQWTVNSENNANTVYKLFRACTQLIDKTKIPSKAGKKSNKSALNETKDTTKSQKTQKSEKEKSKAVLKVSNLVKDRAGPFKPLPCLWDLRLCLRLVELLYSENVSWSSLEQRNNLRSKRDFHHYALRNIRSVLSTDIDKKTLVSYVPNIAAVLYRRCLCRFQDMCDFDEQTTLSCVEMLKDCLTLLFSPHHSIKIDVFLSKITGLNESQSAEHIAAMLEHVHAAFIQLDEESLPEERDVMIKKMAASLIQLASVLLEVPVHSAPEMSNVVTKLEDYVRTTKQDCLNLVSSLLTAGYRMQTDAQFVDDLVLQLSCVLGRIDEEDTSAGEESTSFKSIDARTGHTALTHVCTHLMQRFRCVEHLVGRARDLAAALNYTCANQKQRTDKELKEIYKSVVTQLSQLSTWTCTIGKVRFSIGQGSDKVLNTCVRLYTVLSALAKQIDGEMAQFVRLERLLKLCGKKFSSVCDNLITYLEASMQQQTASKVLRDTKLIPRLVFEAEQFSKHIIMLDSKAKLNYQQYLSLGTARDFRINPQVVQQVLSARNRDDVDDENEDTINEADTQVSPVHSDSDRENDGNETNKRKRETSRDEGKKRRGD